MKRWPDGRILLGLLCALALRVTAAETTGDPLDVNAVLQQAFRYLQADNHVAAEVAFRQIIAVQPDHQQAQFGLGTTLFGAGQIAEALELLEQLREDAPDFYPVLNNLAWMYATSEQLHLRDGRRSVMLAQEAIFRQPGRFEIWNTLAEAYYIIGDYQRSEQAARQALRYAQERNAPAEQRQRYRDLIERARIAQRVEQIFTGTTQMMLSDVLP